MDMSVIDHIHQSPRLGQECSDFSIIPSTRIFEKINIPNNAFSVIHEADTVTLKVRHLDSQQLLTVLGIPDADVV